jgi:hypothetical protein
VEHLENDMDDLFQRAAENYPLQPGKSDWENIAKRLADKFPPHQDILPLKTKKNKKVILVPIVLLVVLAIGWLVFFNPQIDSNKIKSVKSVLGKSRIVENKNDNSSSGVKEKSSYNSTVQNESDDDRYKKNIKKYRAYNLGKVNSGINKGSSFDVENSNEDNDNESLDVNSAANISKEIPVKEFAESPKNDIEKKTGENADAGQGSVTKLKNESPDILSNKKDDNISEAKKEKQVISRKKKGVYIGLVTGLDFSKVQSTSFNNTGFDFGLFLGFNLNSKLSLESGIIFNKKSYKSEGKNFSMNKVGSSMPAGMIINNLESRSSIIEIPVKVKYNFISYRKSLLFVSAGFSAYAMTKEKNNYHVTMNGSLENITGVYDKNDYKLPAVANISLGYEHKIATYLNIRVEPFLKIPLQGMGVGSLPVTSAGLQLGVIRRF